MATTTVNVHQAKSQLSKLLADVERGDEIVIARRGSPVARLVRFQRRPRAAWGSLRVDEPIDDAAFEAMTDDELREWGLV